ncbi:hypothetical protein BC830DRAFT_182288 [Chytriomyces sp. MP71]|nr:hypothetical protein BC830DRAFT_182288 [Chytriomyces sp. MP71]
MNRSHSLSMSDATLTEMSVSTNAPALHASFSVFKENARESAKHEVNVTLPRIVQVIRHVLNTTRFGSGHTSTAGPTVKGGLDLRKNAVDVTATPRKRRRSGRIGGADGAEQMEEVESSEGQDEESDKTPAPVHVAQGGKGGVAGLAFLDKGSDATGMNEDVKELMTLVKKEIVQLLHSVLRIKTWVQLDNVTAPDFNIIDEISAVEKWAMSTLESLHVYHGKRSKLVREISTPSLACGGSDDAREALAELDDFQMHHLTVTLFDVMQSSAVLYAKIHPVIAEVYVL